MAIFHLSMKPLTRKGQDGQNRRSVLAFAAYRAGCKLTDEQIGWTFDYSKRTGVLHTEIVLPAGVDCVWAKDRSQLWNAVERHEKRCDARLAREFELAIPAELTLSEAIELLREFAAYLANRYGVVVDFAIHSASTCGDTRNVHAHVLITTRVVTALGFGQKTLLELADKELKAAGHAPGHEQLRVIREEWASFANAHLAKANVAQTIDARSFHDRGLTIMPTRKMGQSPVGMMRRGQYSERKSQSERALAINARKIRKNPDEILAIITAEKSVFTAMDLRKALQRYVSNPHVVTDAMSHLLNSAALVRVSSDHVDPSDFRSAKFTTAAILQQEIAMVRAASRMAETQAHGVAHHYTDSAIATQNSAIQEALEAPHAGLLPEQTDAIHNLLSPSSLCCLRGVAGAGKSTLLAAANQAWSAAGYDVRGSALAGKAAAGLNESAGIRSQTIASLRRAWQQGKQRLSSQSILVVDEAAMLCTADMAFLVQEANRCGAKLVLVGDEQQVQPIQNGSPFRTLMSVTGTSVITEVRRQRQHWQQNATQLFASGRTTEALIEYRRRGAILFEWSKDDAIGQLADTYVTDIDKSPSASRLALAHRKADVHAINQAIRERLRLVGKLPPAGGPNSIIFKSENGEREFAVGDRIVFLKNDKELAVKNGMLATIIAVTADKIALSVDDSSVHSPIILSSQRYPHVDYGHAVTIHKSQGCTVTSAFVLASKTMDRHMAYVAMSRHKDAVTLFANRGEFKHFDELAATLSRERLKENALDYLHSGVPSVVSQQTIMTPPKTAEAADDSHQDFAEAAHDELMQRLDDHIFHQHQMLRDEHSDRITEDDAVHAAQGAQTRLGDIRDRDGMSVFFAKALKACWQLYCAVADYKGFASTQLVFSLLETHGPRLTELGRQALRLIARWKTPDDAESRTVLATVVNNHKMRYLVANRFEDLSLPADHPFVRVSAAAAKRSMNAVLRGTYAGENTVHDSKIENSVRLSPESLTDDNEDTNEPTTRLKI